MNRTFGRFSYGNYGESMSPYPVVTIGGIAYLQTPGGLIPKQTWDKMTPEQQAIAITKMQQKAASSSTSTSGKSSSGWQRPAEMAASGVAAVASTAATTAAKEFTSKGSGGESAGATGDTGLVSAGGKASRTKIPFWMLGGGVAVAVLGLGYLVYRRRWQ